MEHYQILFATTPFSGGSAEKIEVTTNAELTDQALLTLLIRCVFRNTREDRDLLQSVKDVTKRQYQEWN
ncbi:hypothetical protein AWJ19_21310 [Paenibacillus sp. DMB5]|nr:hypothetical protein AWJ19_21310 [Paenibacillus sp. DMB5]